MTRSTTKKPVAIAPKTNTPTTIVPPTKAPTTIVPTTVVPPTIVPTTDAPVASSTIGGTAVANPFAGRVGMGLSHDLISGSYSVNQIESELRQLRSGGVTWSREDLSWAVAEPRRGVYNWAPFDRLMEAASLSGVHVLGILDYSAPWASSDPSGNGSIFYPPSNDADFAAYATAVAARYGSSGSFWAEQPQLAADPLSAVEVWNEPYGSWYWQPGPDPSAYAALVSQTAPAVHAADPEMQVLMSGNLLSWDSRYSQHTQPWLAEVLRAYPDLASQVDAIDVHPYPSPVSLGPYDDGADAQESFDQIPLIRQVELRAGVTLPLWITEIGWSTAPSSSVGVSPATQATYTQEAIQRAITEWGGYVSKIFVFGWFRSNGVQGDKNGNLGFLNSTGSPQPAWTAVTQLLGSLSGMANCGDCP